MSCAAALVMMAGSARAADGTVNFHGSVVAATCVPTQVNPQIPLPPVGVRTLNETGHGPTITNFEIALTGCPVGIGVRARFDVTGDVDTDTGMLKNVNTSDSPAKNVELALVDRDGTKIVVGEPQTDAPVITDNSGKATLTYGVQYYAVGTVDAGTMDAVASYTVEYI